MCYNGEEKVIAMKKTGIFLLIVMLCLSACASAEHAVVNRGGAALYLQATSSSGRIGTIYAGAPIEVQASAADGWMRVSIGEIDGYVREDQIAGSAQADDTYMASVVSPYGTPSVLVRSQPSNSYEPMGALTVGTQVRIVGESGNFVFILYNGKLGCLEKNEVAR